MKLLPKNILAEKDCLDKYKTQEMCDEVLDSYLPVLKSVSDWFVMNKMVEKFNSSVFSNGDNFFMM